MDYLSMRKINKTRSLNNSNNNNNNKTQIKNRNIKEEI